MHRQKNFNTIFFDLGQTLVNLSSISVCMYKSFKRYLPKQKLDLNKLVYYWGYGTKDLFMELREKKFIETKHIHLLSLKKILEENNIIINNDLEKTLVEYVWKDFINNNKIYLDTKPVLNQLKKLNYKLGIISDCDLDVADGIIKKHNLNKFFDVKVISSEIKSYKPDPQVFSKAVELAKCKPREVVYVGDSEIDIKGAKEVGLFTIIIDRGELESKKLGIEPNYRIKKLTELPDILADLN